MNVLTKHQVISDAAGNPEYAVVPYDEYLQLIEAADADIEPTVPHEVVSAMVDGAGPIKAWREHIGLTQLKLAERMKISQPALAKLEKTEARPRKSTLKKVAAALKISLDHLDL